MALSESYVHYQYYVPIISDVDLAEGLRRQVRSCFFGNNDMPLMISKTVITVRDRYRLIPLSGPYLAQLAKKLGYRYLVEIADEYKVDVGDLCATVDSWKLLGYVPDTTNTWIGSMLISFASLRHGPTSDLPLPMHLPEEPITVALPTKAKAFETRHYVNGADASTLSDEQLIQAMRDLEAEIAALQGVKTESKRIKAKITELNTALIDIRDLLDSR